jgi:hypothetical protein
MYTCNYFVASFQWGDLNHQEASHSMELFAREVMPHFADAAEMECTKRPLPTGESGG